MKKLMVYRMMSSNLFINYSLPVMKTLYKIIGTQVANVLINKTAGQIFTSGETIDSLLEDIREFERKGIYGAANYVAEGLHDMNEQQILATYKDLTDSIVAITEGRPEGHLAIKLTALISIDIMTRVSLAQEIFIEKILDL